VAIRYFAYVRKKGMGSLAKAELGGGLFWMSVLMTGAAGVLIDWQVFAVLLAVALVSTLVLGYRLSKRFGGLSGDMYGFIIEVNELLLLNALILMGSAA
jgi:cobalamin synthase